MNRILQNFVFLSLLLSGSVSLIAQNVGINSTGAAPNGDAILDVSSTNKGLLIPRVSIPNLTLIGPITGGSTTSLLVYNTNVATGIGYYYWDGNDWIKFTTGGDDWKITGNSNTTSGTNFLGTTNATALDFRTNNTLRFRVANGYQVYALGNGTAAAPFYSRSSDANTGMYFSAADQLSFSEGGTEALRITSADRILALNGSQALPTWSFINDPNTGMWRSNTDELAFAAGGVEFMVADANGADQLVVNENSTDLDFRVESNARANMFFVDAGTNRIGINRAAPTSPVHFVTTGENVWLTYWENNTTVGAVAQWNQTLTGNGNRVAMGVTNYSGSANVASAIIGLSLNGTTTGSGGVGITGSANNESGKGVNGTLAFSGGYSGWGGYFAADVNTTGGYFTISDRRLKRDIKPISKALALINKIEPVSYFYDTEKYPEIGLDENRLTYGFIAQDIEQIIPEMVKDKLITLNSNTQKTEGMNEELKEDTFKVLNYTVMIPVLTQAIKEQQALIEAQNLRLKVLEDLIKELQENK
jgi:hypothetical protein